MKKFSYNIVLIATLTALLFFGNAMLRTVINNHRYGDEVFEAIALSGTANTNIENVILGDSVANQLFSRKYQPETTKFIYLASNQAITPIGNCALLKRYLAHNPQTKNVYYMALPGALRNDGGASYTFHYMIFPFVETGAAKEFDDVEMAHLRKRFSSIIFDNTFIRRFIYANDSVYRIFHLWEKKHIEKLSMNKIPMLCERALLKMNAMCKENGVKFVLISSPVVDTSVSKNEATISQLAKIGRGEVARYYLDSQLQVRDELLCDHIHFKSDVLDAQRTNLVTEIFHRINTNWP